MVWTSLYHMGLSWTWTCLGNTGALLLLDLSILEKPELHLDVSTPEGPELHLYLSGQQEPLLLLDVYKLQGPKLWVRGWSQIQ
jgi:hypothetical protein